MASRFNPALRPHPYQLILNRNADGLCALLSCKKPPYLGHSWCSSSHYLLWLAEFTSSLRPDQICKLSGCTRHVFVDDNAPPSEFCGWEHEQEFVKRSALNQRHQQGLPAMEVHPQEPHSPAPSIESECGLTVPSLHSLMHSLKRFALSGIRPKNNIRVVEDFYEKHPWEVCTEGHACLLIARLKFTSKGRRLTTKGHFHWKQSGRPQAKKGKVYSGKYYTYMKRKGIKGKEDDEQECAYTMKEYTMEEVKCYSLIQLVKDKPSSYTKLRQEQPATAQEGVELNDACSGIVNHLSGPNMYAPFPEGDPCTQDLWMYLWNDGTFVDSQLFTS